jgi:nifR3 family TIM-barrel protein
VQPLPFTGPWMLAPMEGVTDPAFREVVLELHRPEVLGGAFTEFVVVSRNFPVPEHVLRRRLGNVGPGTPVGMQLMGPNPDTMAETAACVDALGLVPVLDINFGCPAKGALKSCAGSAALRDPRGMEEIVRRVVDAAPSIPVTAKIRAGFDNADHVEDLARAVEQGGAALLTIHCRTRAEKYQEEVDWGRIARAVAAVSIPVCGNGSIRTHEDLERMRRETGCRYAMVGRGALADPWVFSGEKVDRRRAFSFLCRYVEAMRTNGPGDPRGLSSRVKQLIRYWTAGDAVCESRTQWLRETDPHRFLERLAAEASG